MKFLVFNLRTLCINIFKVYIIVIIATLVGCGGIQISDSDESIAFFNLAADIKPGISRDKVQSIVGKPYQSNEVLHLEIYKHVDKQPQIWPMPPIPFFADLHQFILVLYDENWIVKSAASDNYIVGGYSGFFNIQLEGYTLIAFDSEVESLVLITPPVYSLQEVETVPSKDKCQLFVNIPEDPIGENHITVPWIFLDNEPILYFEDFWDWGPDESIEKPRKLITSQNLFVKFEVMKGPHTLELQGWRNSIVEGHVISNFECHGGQYLIVDIDAQVIHPSWQKYFFEGKIHISDGWPENTGSRRQVFILFDQGKWFN